MILTNPEYKPDQISSAANDNPGRNIVGLVKEKVAEAIYPQIRAISLSDIVFLRHSNTNVPFAFDFAKWSRLHAEWTDNFYKRILEVEKEIRADLLDYYFGSECIEGGEVVTDRLLKYLNYSQVLNILDLAWSENDRDTIDFFRRHNNDAFPNIQKALLAFKKMRSLMRSPRSGL